MQQGRGLLGLGRRIGGPLAATAAAWVEPGAGPPPITKVSKVLLLIEVAAQASRSKITGPAVTQVQKFGSGWSGWIPVRQPGTEIHVRGGGGWQPRQVERLVEVRTVRIGTRTCLKTSPLPGFFCRPQIRT